MSNINDLVSEGLQDWIDKGVDHYKRNETVYKACFGAACAIGAGLYAAMPEHKIGKLGGKTSLGILASQTAYNQFHKGSK